VEKVSEPDTVPPEQAAAGHIILQDEVRKLIRSELAAALADPTFIYEQFMVTRDDGVRVPTVPNESLRDITNAHAHPEFQSPSLRRR
jgi:hypothetical protein